MEIMDEINSNYTYKGRLNRLPYILTAVSYQIFVIINIYLLLPLAQLIWRETEISSRLPALLFALFLFILAVCYCSFFVWVTVYFYFQTIRRLHDLNLTGWLVLARFLIFIPHIGIIMAAVVFIFELLLFILDGTTGTNIYGEKPKYLQENDFEI